MTKRGTKDHDPAVKARAEVRFLWKQEQKREGQSATDDYLAKGDAERTKMAKLREARLAVEAKAVSLSKGKQKTKRS